MSIDFSMRQLLACLNVSVFDPTVEPALRKACAPEKDLETGQNNPFYNAVSLIGMLCASLLCFYGLRPYPFAVGMPLFIICGIAMYRTTSYTLRFFLKTYFISGAFLLTEACFRVFPASVTFLLFVLLMIGIFRPVGRWQRILISVLFFFSVCFIFHDRPIVPLALFFISGTAGLLFPLKNVYVREPAFIFAIFPLLLILIGEIFAVPEIVALSRESLKISVVFTSGLLLLFVGLYRDMEIEEFFKFCAGSVALFACGVFFSVGMEGSLALFLIAFFTNCTALGRIAVILFTCFFVLFFLSLPLSLFFAGTMSLAAGVVFELFRFWLRHLSVKEE